VIRASGISNRTKHKFREILRRPAKTVPEYAQLLGVAYVARPESCAGIRFATYPLL
jgi:hypothetical protein